MALFAVSNAMYRRPLTERKRTPLNELYLLDGTQVDLKDFIAGAKRETFTRPQLRQALAEYLHDRIQISGYIIYEDKSDYDQDSEDVMTTLSEKTAKDILILFNKDVYTVKDVQELFTVMQPKEGQVPVSRIVAYANSILNAMYDFQIETIIKHNLHHENINKLKEDPESFKLNASYYGHENGIDARTFYLLKYVYDGDIRYAHEHTERWDDFQETLFISTKNVFTS